IAASELRPNRQKHAAASTAVASSTAGYRHEIDALQLRHRPRSRSHENTGTLSYNAIAVSQVMHADPGLAIERRSGTRAATTFRNDPMASPGKNARPAAAKPTAQPDQPLGGSICA
ncbi:MAG: hypothetical protein QOG69_1190, partial [Actinomycetota bacterium]|nr:hypothetical protein [Actinomycetota bacterium]